MQELLKTLNPQQKQAVTHDQGPLLIVAGAGTGKTAVITQRIAQLIATGKAKPDQILALTFTDKAAGEMEERVDKLLPYGYVDLWISTFHSFAERILKAHAIDIGLPNDFKLLNQTEQWLLVRQNIERFDLDYYRPLNNPTKFIHALLKLFSRAKDELITPQQYIDYARELELNRDGAEAIALQEIDPDVFKAMTLDEQREVLNHEIKKINEVASAYHTYQQLLLEQNALDFGDLIFYCLRLLKERPGVLARYRSQFKYILVDEFQDTNYAQYELIKLLSAPRNNVTVVGDDDQSIYKFRGASISNILAFKQDYPQAAEVFLVNNYRSRQNILDLSYQFICQNNPNRLEYRLAQGNAQAALSKQLHAHQKGKGSIAHLHFETSQQEIEGIIKKIVALKEKYAELTWNDFAILTRTNDAAASIAAEFARAALPFQFMASRGLYNKPIIMDILAYFKLLDNYHESTALYRILTIPVLGVEPNEMVDITELANRKGWSLFHACQDMARDIKTPEVLRGKLRLVLDLIEKHSRLANQKILGPVVLAFLEDSGYLRNITSNDSTATQEALRYLNQFYKKLQDFEQSFNGPTIRAFLDLIDLELEAGDAGSLQASPDDGPESVKIMTVHASKGLEFAHVFIAQMVDRRFPTDNRSDQISLSDALIKEQLPDGDVHLQEERRLLYVAMTRAKQGLYLTSAEDYGGSRKKKLSRFMTELQTCGLTLAIAAETQKASALPKEIAVVTKAGIEYRIPSKFSFTQLKAFESCPYQYRYAHILRVPVRGKAMFSFGKTIHATMQELFRRIQERSGVQQASLFGADATSTTQARLPLTLDELYHVYDLKWEDDWFKNYKEQEDYKERGRQALKRIYGELEAHTPTPLHLELPFNYKIKDSQGAEYTIRGAIDRVDSIDGGLEIIDYKTGKGKTEEDFSSEDKEQLLIYQLAAEQLFDQPVKKLTFYYIETGNVISFLGEIKDLEKMRNKIIDTIEHIKRGEFSPTPGRVCKFCDFYNICEFRAEK